MFDYDVVVIGAGCGGLTAGAILAKQGRKTLVLEQSELVGGCCSTFERDGFRFDVGASIVEAVNVIDLAFAKMGGDRRQELELLPCDPIYSCLFRDRSRLTYWTSIDQTVAEISRLSPADGRAFYDFAKYFAKFAEAGSDDYFVTPANTFGDLLRLLRKTPSMARYTPLFLQSYQDVMKRFFKDERILQSLTYQTYYFGHPADLTPGLFAVVPYAEHLGIFYPRGGMIEIPLAIKRCGERQGMELRQARVTGVLVGGRRAHGVRLADGTEITSRLVVSNINAKTLYLDLIGEEHLPWLAKRGIKSYDAAMSCPMIYLGVDYEPPLDAHHTLFPLPLDAMNDYSWNDFPAGRLPPEQFGLIAWPTRTDPTLAPAGHHVLNLTLMGPRHLAGTDWDAEKERFPQQAIDFLSRFALPGLRDHVKAIAMTTPLDFERRLLLPGGAIYGLQQDFTAQTVFRPSARSKSIKGLYLTGASTHPGGGVPTTIGSGIIAADLIAKHEN